MSKSNPNNENRKETRQREKKSAKKKLSDALRKNLMRRKSDVGKSPVSNASGS